jgi:hypothetical protein
VEFVHFSLNPKIWESSSSSWSCSSRLRQAFVAAKSCWRRIGLPQSDRARRSVAKEALIQWAFAPRKEPDFPATILFRWFYGEMSGISRRRLSWLRFGAPGRDVKNTEGWPRRSLAKSGRRRARERVLNSFAFLNKEKNGTAQRPSLP